MNHSILLHSPLKPLRKRARCGSVLVLLAILIPVLLALASYAINITYIEAVQADVQIVTDVATQTAGREFNRTGDRNAALLAAKDAASRNPISGAVMPIEMNDLEFGVSLRTSSNAAYTFTPVTFGAEANAVRLTTRTLNQSSTPVISPIFPTMGVNVEIRPQCRAISTQSTMDVALVIDRSGSMAFASDEVAAEGVNPAAAPPGWVFGDPVPPNSRWLDLVASVQAFNQSLIDSPQQEKLALSTYSTTTSTDQVLTFDYSSVINGLNFTSLVFQGGGTAIGNGLLEGNAALNDTSVNRDYAVKVMVLLTDGIHNYGTSPESAAGTLRNNGVTLFTITFSDEADQNRMRNLAQSCGGEHFHATDAAQLASAFEEIANRLPSLMTL
ncbi:vWA domain-containing protein [Neorhodopirellula pilleata]|uniref:von Willebrand factor type A domain protein n=1 Tax=Neorhodopirellula pilleata TaxID=2714738 RepID=A0A5C6AFR9_9BACT|nr:vWA domain-containing protein [Neorhodopirellula pilleata]TWT98814.1 von Willebrand factor type A domain protein [Neorhodopirellula pilleata]